MDEPTCWVIEDGTQCTSPVYVKKYGLCGKHYQRWWKHKDPVKVLNRWGMDRNAEAKVCAVCKRKLPISAFYKRRDRNASDGRPVYRCKDCHKTPEERVRRRNLAQYNLTIDEFDRMLAEQGGVCAICGNVQVVRPGKQKKSFAVDHDHSTGLVRGLLCHPCNVGLGMFREDPRIFLAAMRYLEEAKPGQLALFAA